MAVRHWLFGLLGLALGFAPLAVSAEPSTGARLLDVLQASQSRLQALLASHLKPIERDRPDWLLEQSEDEFDPYPHPGADAAQLVLQQDRRDGADLLTVRHPLLFRGALRAYAGAGINRTTYFSSPEDEPMWLTRRNRHDDYGAAAEVGAELRLSEQVLVSADMRWADLDEAAVLLRTGRGPVGADPVTVGLAIGWRFR
jgi:hypothetical protein